MPELCRFYGIIIRVFTEKGERHHVPHIHVECGGDEASIDLSGEIIAGFIPANKLKYVQVWLEIHASEVAAAWEQAVNSQLPKKIAPLR